MNPAKQQLHIHAQIEASYTHLNINSEGKMIRIHRKYHNLTTFFIQSIAQQERSVHYQKQGEHIVTI